MFIWKLLPLITVFRVKHAVNTFRDTHTSIINVRVEAPIRTPDPNRTTHGFMTTPEPLAGQQFLYSYLISVTDFSYLHDYTR